MGEGRGLRVERFAGAAQEWDAFARTHPGYTHFHQHAWKDLIERVFGHECIYLAARDAPGRLVAVLPLVRVKSLVFGHYLVSMPFLNYGGPLGTDEGVRAVTAEAVRLSDADGVQLLELRSRVALPLDLPVSHRKITVVLELPGGRDQITVVLDLPECRDPAPLWQALGSKLRAQVKRPQKEGLEVRFGPEQVEPFFRIFARHMRDLGTPTQPRTLFEALLPLFGESVWFGCAYRDGQPMAAGCGFRWGGEFEMTWASALSAYKRFAPNMLLYWAFMERAVREGLGLFNFGRCTPGAGTHQFKRQWGSRDEPLWWYQHGRGHTTVTPSPDAGAYALGARAWKHLPLPVATALGPRIVRLIP